MNGPIALKLVARAPKSGLELAVEEKGLVLQEGGQRPKIAFWISVQK